MKIKDGLNRPACTATARMALAGVLAAAIGAWASVACAAEPGLKAVRHDPPKYPRGAQTLGIEGWVTLEFNVDAAGNVVAPRVLEASPPGVFDAAALQALSKWKYEALGTETDSQKVKVVFSQQ